MHSSVNFFIHPSIHSTTHLQSTSEGAGTGLRPWGDKREPKRPGSPSRGARGQALAAMRGQLTWRGGPEASARPQKLAQTLDVVSRQGHLLLNYSNILKRRSESRSSESPLHTGRLFNTHRPLDAHKNRDRCYSPPHAPSTEDWAGGSSPTVSTFQFYPGVTADPSSCRAQLIAHSSREPSLIT